MPDMGGKTLDGQKTEACRVWACRIQKCFKENMYNNMDTACSWEIASLKTCCSKHGANSLHCAFSKEQQKEEKQEGSESTVCTNDVVHQQQEPEGLQGNDVVTVKVTEEK